MRRLATALALAALAGLAPPAAAAETGEITLTGTTSGYVDVTVTHGIHMTRWSIATEGRYAGFWVEPLPDRPESSRWATSGGVLLLKDFRTPGQEAEEMLLGIPAYDFTRYRIYLVADGPTTVTIRTGGPDPARRLRPAKRVTSGAAVTALAAARTVSRRAPATMPRRFLGVTGLALAGTAPFLSDVDVCMTVPRGACPEPRLPVAVPRTDVSSHRWVFAQRGTAGRYDVVHAAVSPLDVTRAVAASFTLQLA